jgi:hypothetical protein
MISSEAPRTSSQSVWTDGTAIRRENIERLLHPGKATPGLNGLVAEDIKLGRLPFKNIVPQMYLFGDMFFGDKLGIIDQRAFAPELMIVDKAEEMVFQIKIRLEGKDTATDGPERTVTTLMS